MKNIDKFCALIAVTALVSSVNGYALNVLADPDFKGCAEQYQETKRLSKECDDLWRAIEQRITDDIESKVSAFNCGEFKSQHSIGQCQKKAEEYRQCRLKEYGRCDQVRESNDLAITRERTLAKQMKNPKDRDDLRKLKSLALPQGKKAVLEKLKDPDSAKFRKLKVSDDAVFLCGEVNAKNSMGGYTGFKRFFAFWANGVVEIEDGTSPPVVFNNFWEENCVR